MAKLSRTEIALMWYDPSAEKPWSKEEGPFAYYEKRGWMWTRWAREARARREAQPDKPGSGGADNQLSIVSTQNSISAGSSGISGGSVLRKAENSAFNSAAVTPVRRSNALTATLNKIRRMSWCIFGRWLIRSSNTESGREGKP